MKKLLMIIAVVGFIVASQDAQAQTRIVRNQTNQNVRIAHGVRSGKLTPIEAKMLRMQQLHIRQMKQLAKADGVVTRGERVIINRAQARANRAVYYKKHNGRNRY